MISSLRLSARSATAPAHGAEEQHGHELAGGEQAEGDAAVGELQHEQGLGDQRQPVAGLGDELAGEEEPEVADRAASGRCPARRADTRVTSAFCRRVVAERLEDVERGGEPLAARPASRAARRVVEPGVLRRC